MTVLVVDNLAKFYGAELVFSGVTFTVPRGGRTGLVGPNGSGKTTLLEIIAGRLTVGADFKALGIACDGLVHLLSVDMDIGKGPQGLPGLDAF